MLLYVVLTPEAQIAAVKEYRAKDSMPLDEFFEEVYKQDYFMKEDFAAVEIVNGALSFSLIPSQMFAPARIKEFAGALIKEKVDAEHLAFRKMDLAEATAIYSIPLQVKKKCDFYFKDPEYLPSCQPIMNLADHLAEENGNLLLLTMFPNQFVVTGIKKGHLSICNSYDYQSSSDLVYFTQLVMDLLEVEGERCPIMIQGDLDLRSPFYSDIQKYLPEHHVPGGLLQERFVSQEGILPYHKYAYLTF